MSCVVCLTIKTSTSLQHREKKIQIFAYRLVNHRTFQIRILICHHICQTYLLILIINLKEVGKLKNNPSNWELNNVAVAVHLLEAPPTATCGLGISVSDFKDFSSIKSWLIVRESPTFLYSRTATNSKEFEAFEVLNTTKNNNFNHGRISIN
jgi:hypothetical protein